MSKAWKALLGAALILCVLFCPAAAEEPQKNRFSLSPEFVRAEGLQVFPGGDGGFYLLSRDERGTQLAYLPASGGPMLSAGEWPLSYTACCLQGDTLYIALPTMEFSSLDNQFHRFTQLICWDVSTGQSQSLFLRDCYPALEQDMAVDTAGTIHVIDSENRSSLQRFDPTGALLEHLPAPEPMGALIAGETQDLLAYGIYNGQLYRMQQDDFTALDDCTPGLPLRHLGYGQLIDGTGTLYQWQEEPGAFLPAFSLYCTPAQCAQTPSGLLTITEDGLLLLDRSTGEPLGQFAGIPNGQQLCVSGDWALTIASGPDGYEAAFTRWNQPPPIQWQEFAPQGGGLTEEELLHLWNQCLPQNRDPLSVYEEEADTINFTTPGKPSAQALADGLSAIHFYRRLYALEPLTLSPEDCHSIQYGAVLALFEDRPAAMPELFYQIASNENCRQADTVYGSSLSAAPLAQAVHQLWKQGALGDLLFSSQLNTLAMGCATHASGKTASLIYGDSTGSSPSILADPPPGSYPLSLLGDKEWRISLGELVAGTRGCPVVTVTDESTGEQWEFDDFSSLQGPGATLLFSPPPAREGHSYFIQAINLCTSEGIPAAVQYRCSISGLELPWPDETSPPTPGGAMITSQLYDIDRQTKTISGIPPSTTLAACKKNLMGDGQFQFVRNGKPLTSGTVGTGTVVQLLQNGTVLDSLTLLVAGDLTGEGNCNTLDRRALYAHLLGETPLDGLFLQAADLNQDHTVDTLDLLLLQKHLSGGYALPPSPQ